MIRTYTPSQIADGLLAGDLVRETEFVLALEIERLRAFEAAHRQLQAALDAAIRERDEARAEVDWLRAENKRLFTRRCEVERLRADRVHRNDLRAEAWEEGWFARDCQKSDWNENPYRGGEGNERHN